MLPSATAVQTFYVTSPCLNGPLVLRQPDVGGAIGFKLYPAALTMCGLLEHLLVREGVLSRPLSSLDAAAAGSALPRRAPTTASAADAVAALLPGLSLRGAVVLEVGAGICALPSLVLARVGATCVPTVRWQ